MKASLLFILTLFLIITTSCSNTKPNETTESADNEVKTSLIAEGARLTQVADDFIFTEGPAVDKEGNVYFTDQPNDRIIRWSVDGTLSTYMDSTGRANGLYFDHEGNLIACADLHNQLWEINENKEVTVLVNDFEGKKLNGPNDLWIDLKGGIYFTDPFYKRNYWEDTSRQARSQNVYYLSPDKEDLEVVATGLVRPNGIIGTPDGEKIYISDLGVKKTYSYQINEDGTLSDKQLYVEMGSDGMTIDNLGNIYLTNEQGVTVFNPAGDQIENIPVNQSWTANVTFGGKEQKTLFITAMNSLYTLKMNVHGVR